MVEFNIKKPSKETPFPSSSPTVDIGSLPDPEKDIISKDPEEDIMVLIIRAAVKTATLWNSYSNERTATNYANWYWANTRKTKIEQGIKGEEYDESCKKILIERLQSMASENSKNSPSGICIAPTDPTGPVVTRLDAAIKKEGEVHVDSSAMSNEESSMISSSVSSVSSCPCSSTLYSFEDSE